MALGEKKWSLTTQIHFDRVALELGLEEVICLSLLSCNSRENKR